MAAKISGRLAAMRGDTGLKSASDQIDDVLREVQTLPELDQVAFYNFMDVFDAFRTTSRNMDLALRLVLATTELEELTADGISLPTTRKVS